MAQSTFAHNQNRLLSKLSKAELQRLDPWLKVVDLPHRQELYKAGAPIEFVFFPTGGVASSVAYVKDGMTIEVSTVGNEGAVGLPALFGPSSSPNEVFMQVAGAGFRMPSSILRREAGVGSPIYGVMAKYLSAYLFQVSQGVACNGVHTVRQRCSRWLLMTQDRVHSDEVPLTHEFLGVMLGVRRASVTEVLQPLQERGLIRSERGLITVLNRRGLEAESCECYRLVVDEFERLLR